MLCCKASSSCHRSSVRFSTRRTHTPPQSSRACHTVVVRRRRHVAASVATCKGCPLPRCCAMDARILSASELMYKTYLISEEALLLLLGRCQCCHLQGLPP